MIENGIDKFEAIFEKCEHKIKHDKILTSINYIFSKSKRVYINRRIIHDAILSYNHMTKVPIMVLKKAVDEI